MANIDSDMFNFNAIDDATMTRVAITAETVIGRLAELENDHGTAFIKRALMELEIYRGLVSSPAVSAVVMQKAEQALDSVEHSTLVHNYGGGKVGVEKGVESRVGAFRAADWVLFDHKTDVSELGHSSGITTFTSGSNNTDAACPQDAVGLQLSMPETAQGNETIARTGLFDLYQEIRDMIYHECLNVGKVFPEPCPSRSLGRHYCNMHGVRDRRYQGWRGYKKPELQLLTVCKRVFREAGAIYFSQNHFVIGAGFHSWPFNFRLSDHMYGLFSDTFTPHAELAFANIRSLSITFNKRDNVHTSGNFEMVLAGALTGQYERLMDTDKSDEEKMKLIHDGLLGRQKDVWSRRWQQYRKMKLDLLEVSFDYCRCPLTCHRLTGEVWLYEFLTGWEHEAPKKVVINGLMSKKELNTVRNMLERHAPMVEPSTELHLSFLFEKGRYGEDEEVNDVYLSDVEDNYPIMDGGPACCSAGIEDSEKDSDDDEDQSDDLDVTPSEWEDFEDSDSDVGSEVYASLSYAIDADEEEEEALEDCLPLFQFY